jgi:hypothetical protein
MRSLTMLLFCAVAVSAVAAESHVSSKTIDLSRPGAMEELQKTDPAAHAKAAQFIETAAKVSCEHQEFKALQVQLQIKEVGCMSALFKASYPAKRDITFSIDGQRYYSLVTVTGTKALLSPGVPGK